MAKKSSAQNIVMWILMILLIAGLGGFGIDSFLGSRATSIGQVGDRSIPAQTYANALQQEMNAYSQQTGEPITLARAQQLRIDESVRSQLIVQAALDNEAERIGISVGDEAVQEALVGIDAFQGPTGGFDRETYRFRLENSGQTPAQFEEELRRDTARSLLQTATAAGIETPENLRAALMQFYATPHSFDVFTLTEEMLPEPVADPSDDAVQAYYDANIERFTAPELREITYAWLTPEMVRDDVEVSDDAIRTLYEQRIDEYVQPERRLVERLVFGTEDEAQQALAQIEAGDTSFDALVEARGLTLDDVDLGDVSEAQLGAAGETVFALDEAGSVVGPLPSTLGPALFRMNAILNAQEVSFEEARDELRDELAADGARRLIADRREALDDLLAGGATLEDMADETEMQLGTISWSAESNEGVAAYTEFADAAATVTSDDFPELGGLSDGGLFALRLDAVIPPAPRPLDEVRDEVAAGAREQAVEAALMALGQDWSAELAANGTEAFGEAHQIAAESFEGVTRLDRIGQIPDEMMESLMTAEPGTPILNVGDGQALLALTGPVGEADPENPQTAQLMQSIDGQIGQALAQDVYTYFARALQAEAGISLDQNAINAVHANFR
ncbi:SurA N-terminal domain-containing protein [Rhodobacter sp. NTK016B]|uniref:SurA N-terminal domain-containing protein n=1 Tax=Rhodobacter sp. NTK016B TaxID=2759676 RepID=UPI001A8E0604|nr:SurA N-terminal domain-containing protein [Rhodobacter sp. NTK016B]MBN8293731.1 SurA N-terminal domain-containing protein [Rhodobacter sp. NTK016B]